MSRFNKVGLAVLAVIGAWWLVKGCMARSSPGYKLAVELNERAGGAGEVEIKSSESSVEQVSVDGADLKIMVIRLGSPFLYDNYERMLTQGNSGGATKLDGEAATMVMSRPFMLMILREPSEGFVLGIMKERDPGAKAILIGGKQR